MISASPVSSQRGLLVLIGSANLQSTIVAGEVGNTASRYNLIGNVGSATGFTGNGNQTGTAATPLNPQLATNDNRLPMHENIEARRALGGTAHLHCRVHRQFL